MGTFILCTLGSGKHDRPCISRLWECSLTSQTLSGDAGEPVLAGSASCCLGSPVWVAPPAAPSSPRPGVRALLPAAPTKSAWPSWLNAPAGCPVAECSASAAPEAFLRPSGTQPACCTQEREARAPRSAACGALGHALAALDEAGAACGSGGGGGAGADCRPLSTASTSAALGRTLGSTAMHACHRSATPCGQSSGTLRGKDRPC